MLCRRTLVAAAVTFMVVVWVATARWRFLWCSRDPVAMAGAVVASCYLECAGETRRRCSRRRSVARGAASGDSVASEASGGG